VKVRAAVAYQAGQPLQIEYITEEGDRRLVRESARALAGETPRDTAEASARWREALGKSRSFGSNHARRNQEWSPHD